MFHNPVLLKESIDLLNIKPDGIYLDGTFGRGGHSKEIISKLGKTGKLIIFDKDIEAIMFAKNNFTIDTKMIAIHDSFANFDKYLLELGINSVDGVLLDLGISSPQIDNPQRGFSFKENGILDMRMDTGNGMTAREWINKVDENVLAKILWEYGEESFAKKIAFNIVRGRAKEEIISTKMLAKIISDSVPNLKTKIHKATKSFQAIRIFINNELRELEIFLKKIPQFLAMNARVVIISFHSLEDRIVKNCFNDLSKKDNLPKWVMSRGDDFKVKYRVIAKKVRPSQEEIRTNTRSRSAILRAIEKIA